MNSAQEQVADLELIASYGLTIPGPSGLSLNYNGTCLWVVSDQTGLVYQISLKGQTQRILAYKGKDLEGITQNPEDKTLWVAEERNREIVQIDTLGNELARYSIPVEQINQNSGLEGITINSSNRHIFLLNEKDPGLLIELDTNKTILNQYELDLTDDYSGIFYEQYENALFIVSDASEIIIKCDITGNLLESYYLGIPKLEGISLDMSKKIVYLVSDSKEKLYLFSFE